MRLSVPASSASSLIASDAAAGEIGRVKAMLKILLRRYLDSADNQENDLVKQVKALLNNQLE